MVALMHSVLQSFSVIDETPCKCAISLLLVWHYAVFAAVRNSRMHLSSSSWGCNFLLVDVTRNRTSKKAVLKKERICVHNCLTLLIEESKQRTTVKVPQRSKRIQKGLKESKGSTRVLNATQGSSMVHKSVVVTRHRISKKVASLLKERRSCVLIIALLCSFTKASKRTTVINGDSEIAFTPLINAFQWPFICVISPVDQQGSCQEQQQLKVNRTSLVEHQSD